MNLHVIRHGGPRRVRADIVDKITEVKSVGQFSKGSCHFEDKATDKEERLEEASTGSVGKGHDKRKLASGSRTMLFSDPYI